MKSELLKLVPAFLTTQILYWIIFYIPTDQPGLWTAFIKCLPVSTLAFYLGTSDSKNSLVQGLFWGMVYSIGNVQFLLILPTRGRFGYRIFLHFFFDRRRFLFGLL